MLKKIIYYTIQYNTMLWKLLIAADPWLKNRGPETSSACLYVANCE